MNNRARLNPAMEEAMARALGKQGKTVINETQSEKETKMESTVNKEVNVELTKEQFIAEMSPEMKEYLDTVGGPDSEAGKMLVDTFYQSRKAALELQRQAEAAGVTEEDLSAEVEKQLNAVLENLATEKAADTETQSQQKTTPMQKAAQPQTKEDKMKDEIMKQYPGINENTVKDIIFIRETVKAGEISQEEIILEMKHLVTKRDDLNKAALFEEYKSHLTEEGLKILKEKCGDNAEVKEAVKTTYLEKAKAIAPWVIGGLAVAGAGYAAYKYFTSQSEAEGIVTAVMGESAGEVASGVAAAIAGYFA